MKKEKSVKFISIKCNIDTLCKDGRVRLFFKSFVHRLLKTNFIIFFSCFQNFRSFSSYFVSFLTGKIVFSSKFHKKKFTRLYSVER